MKVGVLGGPGTFAWLAFRRFAELCRGHCSVQYFDDVDSLVTALLRGEIDVTCLAIQTSPGGFTAVADEVLRHRQLVPLAETVLPYHCTLYVREGYTLQQVRLVLGHRSLELARNWLRRHLPEARLEVRGSTAEAAREVIQSNGDRAVVGSPALQEFVPGLTVAARGIDEGALARWWAIGRSPLEDPLGTRALVAGYSVTAAELSTFLAECARRGLRLEALYLGPARGPEFRCDVLLAVQGEAPVTLALPLERLEQGSRFSFRAAYRVF